MAEVVVAAAVDIMIVVVDVIIIIAMFVATFYSCNLLAAKQLQLDLKAHT